MSETTLHAVLYQLRDGPEIIFTPSARNRLLDLEPREIDQVRAKLKLLGMADADIAKALPNDRADEHNGADFEPPPSNGPDDYGNVKKRSDEPATEPESKLTFLDAASLEGKPIPERRWLVRNRIPMENVTLLNGDGAAGKTTITLQLAASIALGVGSWLGAIVEEPGPVLFFSAEEDADEVHRRLGAIVEHHAAAFRDLAGLHLHCIPGEDAVLGAASRNSVVQPTRLYRRLETAACEMRPALVAVEASADVFAGNENDRAQVRQFLALLRALAIKSGAAVLLLSHPSLTGLNTGTGTSGSTGWNNSVRSRLYFTGAKRATDDEPDFDLRELKVMKSNYGPPGEIVRLRWDRGVFIPEGGPGTLERVAAEAHVDEIFLRCLDVKAAQGILVVPTTGRGYAPATFQGIPEADGLNRKALAAAMERLFSSGRIKVENKGSASRPQNQIVRCDRV